MKTFFSILFFFMSMTGLLAQLKQYVFLKNIDLPGNGKWDYLKIDSKNERLFVSHQDRVHIVDLTTEKPIGEITGLKGVHGIALAEEFNKGFISNGTDNTITIFDFTTLKVLKTINIPGKKADAILYDEFSKQVLVFNNGSGNVVAINAATDAAQGPMEVAGAPEFAVSDGKGTVFNNNEDTNEVTVIDALTMKVKN